jgi:ABC-type transporter Mla maintaining outer membrane lipid asymmetry ATPase subunit MlaF
MGGESPILIAFDGVVKEHGGAMPLRVQRLSIRAGERVVLTGLDRAAAETVVHLISGAALPDEGRVRTAGVDTRAIATDTTWLMSLDRFGMVTDRAVLLDGLPAGANIALPLTVAIDPMDDATRTRVAALADEVQLDRARLALACGNLNPPDRLRVLLARALAGSPEFLLLEHPTAGLRDPAASAAFGRRLSQAAAARAIGWLALSDDRPFARASRGARWRIDAGTGVVSRVRWWQ